MSNTPLDGALRQIEAALDLVSFHLCREDGRVDKKALSLLQNRLENARNDVGFAQAEKRGCGGYDPPDLERMLASALTRDALEAALCALGAQGGPVELWVAGELGEVAVALVAELDEHGVAFMSDGSSLWPDVVLRPRSGLGRWWAVRFGNAWAVNEGV